MHDVVIRRSVYDKNPWIAQSLYDACDEAKSREFFGKVVLLP